ncbi:MAG: hypothetical protein K0S65_6334, partial [Labilithrix sp.]|nr:hypothetical protein [Labilithrix sp.]
TGHAVLDAIAPDLYDAMTPQSLAMHEAIADLVSLHCAIRCRALSDKVLADVGGKLEGAGSTAFSVLAAELGEARDPLADYLRDLAEQVGLPGSVRGMKKVASSSPHDLSVVLSGALYRVLLHHYGTARKDVTKKGIPASLAYKNFDKGPAGVWQCALFLAAERFKRFVFRALDYLPPGDATWLDLSHAILACDQAHHPDADDLRDALVRELVRRGVGTEAELKPVPIQHDDDLLRGIDLKTLLESDWAAHEWVRRRREQLGIPPDVPFDVRRRLDVTKRIYHRAGRHEQSRELVLKVAWEQFEDNPKELLLARRRSVTRGTTLAIQWAEHASDHRILAHITSSSKARDRAERDALLLRLEDDGLLRRAEGAASRQLGIGQTLYAEVTDDVMTMKGGARLLHIVSEKSDD